MNVLGRFMHEESEAAILEFLKIETDITIRTFLAMDLCQQLSEHAIEVVRQEIQTGDDSMLVSLEEMLMPVAEVLGIDLPEAEQWKRERDKRDRQIAANAAFYDEAIKRQKARIASGTDLPSSLSTELPVVNPPLAVPTVPIRRTERRVGRNDPCPCGSGKKFKKCCIDAS